MTEKRFELGKSENQDTIFDNEGPDDYYHLGNDTRDVKALCKLLNELHEENQLNKLQEENQQLKKIIKENSKTINQLSEENQELKNGEAIQEFERRLLNLINIIKETSDENRELKKEINDLKELIELIADAHSYTKEESVKDILRHEIGGIDTVAGESAEAWNDYCILSNFFKEHYGEHWDNDKYD